MRPGLSFAFVVPPLEGPQTGGTIYNRKLIGALHELGVRCTVAARDQALDKTWNVDVLWVDSLYLRDELLVPRLTRVDRTKLGLLLHALPSLIDNPAARAYDATSAEARALTMADLALVPSVTFAKFVRARLPHVPLLTLEPGVETPAARSAPRRARRALVAQHVVPNKQLHEWLGALARLLLPSDDFHIEVVGRLDLCPEYAERCATLVRAHPHLERVVRLIGERPQAELHLLMQESDLVISTSPFETFNMALAEARRLGVPLLAREGGHSATHVDPRAGGALARTHEELARLVLDSMREPSVLVEKRRLAESHKPRARSWSDAARELLDALSRATSA